MTTDANRHRSSRGRPSQLSPARSVRRAAALGIPAGVAAAALLLAAAGSGWAAREATADQLLAHLDGRHPVEVAAAAGQRAGGGR